MNRDSAARKIVPQPSSAPARAHARMVDLEVPQTAGIFKGAFGDRILLESCANATIFDPCSPEQAYRGIAKLKEAIEKGPGNGVFSYMSHNALIALAVTDLSGTSMRVFQELIIQIFEHSKQTGVVNSQALERYSKQLFSGQATSLTSYPELMGVFSDSLTIKQTPAEQGGAPSSKKVQSTNHTLAKGNSLLQEACELAIKSYLIERMFSETNIDREPLRKLYGQIADEQISFAERCKQLVADSGLEGELMANKASPEFRTYNLVTRLGRVSNKHQDLIEQMRRAHRENPFNGPKVLLLAGRGKLFDDAIQKNPKQTSPCDDLMCAESTFLLTFDQNSLCFAHVNYDEHWGKLVGGNSVDIYRDFGRGFIPEEGRYAWTQLARIVNMFPSIDFRALDSKFDELEKDPQFVQYLQNKNLRYGPQLMRNKAWLEGPDRDPKLIEFLGELTDALTGKKINPDLDLKPWIRQLQSIFAGSFFAASHIEDFAISYLQQAVRQGTKLEEFTLDKYGKSDAKEWLTSFVLGEMRFGSALVFNLGKECFDMIGDSRNLNALALAPERLLPVVKTTEFGLDYLIGLIDPTNRYHQLGDDCRELQELKALMDQRYARY